MKPLVIVVRDPDYSNDIHVFGGEVETYDIDLGYMDVSDPVEFVEWAYSRLESAAAFDAEYPEAAAFIRSCVEQTCEYKCDDVARVLDPERGAPSWGAILAYVSARAEQ